MVPGRAQQTRGRKRRTPATLKPGGEEKKKRSDRPAAAAPHVDESPTSERALVAVLERKKRTFDPANGDTKGGFVQALEAARNTARQ